MRTIAAGAAAATVLGVALLVAADGAADTVSWATVQNVVVALVLSSTGAPLARRPGGRVVGGLLLLGGSAMALGLLGGGWAATGWPGAGVIGTVADESPWPFSVVLGTTVLLAVFPDGRPLTPRWRPVVWLGWAATLVLAARPVVGTWVTEVVGGALWTLAGAASLASLVVRWRRSAGEARAQLEYLLLAGILVVLLYASGDVLPYHAQQAAFLAVPLLLIAGVVLAVLRHRLYDVEPVLRRTAVFAGLTALVSATYLAVAAAVGESPSERAALAAAVVVAAVAEPARRRLQRGLTRLLYGRRDEPLAALAELRARLERASDAGDVADVVADVVPRLLRSRGLRLELLDDGQPQEVARAGRPGEDGVAFPLVHQGELLGTLTVGPRDPGGRFGPADTALLTELAHQVAGAAHAVRLRAELRTAADRVLRAAEQERSRLRQDLHDRLGPLLVGTGLALDGLRRGAGDAQSAAALDEVAIQVRAASAEVRRIVDRLGPVRLVDLGLPAALAEHLDRLARLPGVPRTGLVVRGLTPLPPVVEEAAYFVVLEAVTNAVRHAGARRVDVALAVDDGVLQVEVSDDGVGLAEPYVAGVGMGSMLRRALQLGGTFAVGPAPGGGTRVAAALPVHQQDHGPPADPARPSTPEDPCPTPPSVSSSPTTTPSSGSGCSDSSTPSPGSRSWGRRPTPTPPSPEPASSLPTSS